MSTHPLFQRLRAPFATRPIERMGDAIVSAIEAEYRGIVVHGKARFGKSWAIRYLCSVLTWLPGPAWVTRVNVPKSHARSEGAFFSLFLERLGLAFPERSSPLERVQRLRNHLIAKCNELGTDLAIIFLDEAQRLFPDDYEHLCTLDNEMTERGYMLFVVFVHQSDFTGSVMEKIYDGNPPPHVYKRYLVRKHVFSGLVGLAEVEHALDRLDEHSEFPPGSGRSYCRAFAEMAFEAGWRFRHHAKQLLDRAELLRKEHKLPAQWTWPMKSFEVCVNYLLTNVAANRPDFVGFTDEDIDSALEAAGYVELERSRGSDSEGE